jgi:hypothetical protein
MSTVPDLIDAYRDLADHAPTVADLQLTKPLTPRARRGQTTRAVLATLIAVIAVVATIVYLRSHVSGKHEPPAEVPQPRWPDSYSFGPDSLPGYTLTRTDIQVPGNAKAASTAYSYAKPGTNMQATLTVLSASKLGRYRDGRPLTVNGRHGYYQAGPSSFPPPPTGGQSLSNGTLVPPTESRSSPSSPPPLVPPLSSAIAWPIDKDGWAVLTVGPTSFSYVNGKLQNPGAIPSQAATVDLAESVRPRQSPTVAPVKVGYLPANLELSSVQQFLESPVMTFDNRFGKGYRDLMFVDRSARSQIFTLDIGVLVAAQKPLELNDLPDARTIPSGNWSPTPYDPAKQWTQKTIAGHRAFVAAHAVIVNWGGVEVHVTNQNLNFTVKPVLPQEELIRVAASLTVPSSGAVGHGYPLSQAVPAANLR